MPRLDPGSLDLDQSRIRLPREGACADKRLDVARAARLRVPPRSFRGGNANARRIPLEVFASAAARTQGLPSVKRLHPCGFPALGGEGLSLHDCDFRRGSGDRLGAGARMSVAGRLVAARHPRPAELSLGNSRPAADFEYASRQRRQPVRWAGCRVPLRPLRLKLSGWDVILPQTRHQVARIRCRDRSVEVLGGFHH